ncbi:FtsK/SpoIIIE domain-containing protein [Myceligenerans cantabricum]
MTHESEGRTPSDAELAELVYGNNPVVGDGLDQGMVQPEDNPGPAAAEVIDAPAPSAEVAARPARVVEHRPDSDVPVWPEWLTSWDVFVPAFRRHAKFLATWSAHHGVRAPFLYLPRFLGRAAIGLGVCTKAVARWVLDSENKAKRNALIAGARGTAEYKTLRKEHADGVRARLGGLAAAGALFGVAGVTTYANVGPDGLTVAAVSAGAAAITAFGVVGTRRVAKPIADTATSEVPKLTVDVVQEALLTLGLGSLGEAKRGLAEIKVLRIFPATGGVEIHIDLPPGATAADVIERKERLAAALRRPIDCVWPEGNPKAHPSRLNLYIADKALSERGAVPFKHRLKGETNVFEDLEIGQDQRGRPVTTCLMYNNGIIGGLPGMGKTFLLRVLIMAAALDPRTELHIHELKGTGDLLPFAPIAHVCRSGDDPEDLKALLADLRAVQAEMRRRAAVIRSLPRSVALESKVTDQLAAVGNPHGFKPLLLVIDESQLGFSASPEAELLVEDITRRGRALGIMVWLATQRPNKTAIPTGISALLSLRMSLRVGDQTTNDMVLGTSMYKAGHRATIFSQEDKGVALLAGEKSDPQLVRGAYIDGELADKIVERARTVREARGLLTGEAAGEIAADTDHSTILDHILAVWPAEDPEWPNGKIWSSVLAERLAEHKPALYEGWTGPQVTAAVKNHGVPVTKSVKRPGGGVQVGFTRTHISDELGTTDTTDTATTNDKED